MAITNLTNTSWYFNETLISCGLGEPEGWGVVPGYYQLFNITFTSANQDFISLEYDIFDEPTTMGDSLLQYRNSEDNYVNAWTKGFDSDYWEDEVYRTITITGGEDVTNPDLITWIKANAVQLPIEDTDDPEDPNPGDGGDDGKPDDGHYLLFSSPSEFTLSSLLCAYIMGLEGDEIEYIPEKSWDGIVEYSTNALDWSTWEGDAPLQSVNGKLYLRGIGNTQMSCDEFPRSVNNQIAFCTYQWSIEGEEVSCTGNLENLLDYTVVANGEHPELAEFGFTWLFYECQALVTAPDFLGECAPDYAFREMFRGCTNLRTPPKLAATTLGACCYTYMFVESGIDKLPELPGIVLGQLCYEHMFEGCANIKISTEKTDEYKYEYRIPSSGTAICPEGWEEEYWSPCPSMLEGTGGTFTGDPELHTTYYTSNEIIKASEPVEPETPTEPEITKPSATFDLSTLNLPAGTYTIYVTLSAEGYRDSEPSNVVEYVVKFKLIVETELNEAGGLTYRITAEDYTTTTNDVGGTTYDIGGNQ